MFNRFYLKEARYITHTLLAQHSRSNKQVTGRDTQKNSLRFSLPKLNSQHQINLRHQQQQHLIKETCKWNLEQQHALLHLLLPFPYLNGSLPRKTVLAAETTTKRKQRCRSRFRYSSDVSLLAYVTTNYFAHV